MAPRKLYEETFEDHDILKINARCQKFSHLALKDDSLRQATQGIL